MKLLRGTMTINDGGRLTIGGCDTVELAAEFGTPLYVLDEALIRSRCRAYLEGLAGSYPRYEVIYAGKALLTSAICHIIRQEGLSLDVVSGGELYTALNAGFPPERIYFHGSNKSEEELRMAIDAGTHRVVVDNFHEFDLIEKITARPGRPVDILIRLTPGVNVHTHSYIQTGQVDSKFGFGLGHGVAREAVRRALSLKRVRLHGFHCHIGSQIFEIETYRAAVESMFDFFVEIRDELGFVADELNLGGGLGIRYTGEEDAMDPKDFAEAIAGIVSEAADRRRYPYPRLMIEPGRSIVGEAGTTLYRIGSVKEIPGVRTYVAVDGGIGDNPRVALYQAKYEALVANKANRPADRVVSVAGKACESGDMLIWDIELPQVEPGDILAVFATGAYNYAMANNYNRLPRPAMVLVADGEADLIVARETYQDLVRFDRVPERFTEVKGGAAAVG